MDSRNSSLQLRISSMKCGQSAVWVHNGRTKFITPFVGAQKDVCKAFGFDITEDCGTEYRSRKIAPRRRGRPAKAKTVKLES